MRIRPGPGAPVVSVLPAQRPQPGPPVLSQAVQPGPAALERPALRAAAAAALPAADVLALLIAVAITGVASAWPLSPAALLYPLGVLAISAGLRQYRLRITLRAASGAARIAVAALLPALVTLPWLAPGRAALLALLTAGLMLAFRAAACTAVRAARRRGLLADPALVVGAGTMGAHLAEEMLAHPELGLVPCGFIDDGPARRDLPAPWLGGLDDLPAVAARLRIRRIVVSFTAARDEDLVAPLRASRLPGTDICVLPRLHEVAAAVPLASLDEIWGIPLVPLRRAPSAAGRAAKRAFDIAAAAILLALTAPLVAVLAAAIRLRSGPPVLFRQVRCTGQGRSATIVKLRTLPGQPGPDTRWTVPPGECGWLGRLLRATHTDELPQLVNVLRGDMSLVGPRPERPYFAGRFRREVPGYGDRERVPAGLTGWAQVHGLNGDTSISERCRFDNFYIEHWSPWLDLVILARTFAAARPGQPGGAA